MPASTHLARLTYGQEVAGSTVVHLEPLDGELAVASHWVAVFDSISVLAASKIDEGLDLWFSTLWEYTSTPCCALIILVAVWAYLSNRRTGGGGPG